MRSRFYVVVFGKVVLDCLLTDDIIRYRFPSDTLPLGYTLRVSLYGHSVINKERPRSGSKFGCASLRTGGPMTV